jgi:hypothetical protein
MDPLYLVLEIGVAALFAAAAWEAVRRGRPPILELLSAATFGLLLEEGDQLIFETYEYSPEFILAIDRAPLLIGLTWALIILGAMRITDALGVRRRYASFADSVLAIMLDLAFDAVAIRLGLWTWRDVGQGDAWFGVPAGNFYAWLFVTFAFSTLTRWLRRAAHERPSGEWLQLLVPIPAFFVLLAALVPFTVLKPLVDPSPGGGLLLFWVTLAGFVAVAAYGIWGPDRRPPRGLRARLDLRLAFFTRLAIHLVFLWALLALGLATDEPVLLIVALVMLAVEVALGWLVAARHRPTGMGRPGDVAERSGGFAEPGATLP